MNRFHYYETYWKFCGLGLIDKNFAPDDVSSILDFGCGRGEVIDKRTQSHHVDKGKREGDGVSQGFDRVQAHLVLLKFG